MHKRALLQALLLICLGWVAGEGDENAGEPIHIFTARHGHGLNTTATNYEILVNSTADDPNSLAALALENRILRKRLHDLRVEYGAIYCKLNDIGPTGGFCMSEETAGGVGGNEWMDGDVCDWMAQEFKGKTVLDLGCGLGQYGKAFAERNMDIKWTGFDGSENIEKLTEGRVIWMDLAAPQWVGKSFDWVMALEVGEHIPALYEKIFLDNIVRHAREGVILSWAVPDQPGHHHVNNKANTEVIQLMEERGFVFDKESSEAVRRKTGTWWFQHTLMKFRRKGTEPRPPEFQGAQSWGTGARRLRRLVTRTSP